MLRFAPLLLLLALPLADDSDVVTLQSGKEIECRVMFENAEKVVYKAKRKVREVERGEVASVDSIETRMRTFLERFEALDRTDIAALSDLALWAESQDLAGEARNLWIRVLLLDNENEQAWTKLGGSKGRKGWRIKVRGRYKTLDQLRERAAEWKTAMELPTAHYLIKTNADPTLALDASIDIERIHQVWYEVMGQALELFPFEETPELHVYADAEDAPRPPQPSWSAWYERVGNAVMVRGLDADVHEIRKAIVYMLVRNSFRLALGNRDGALPWWAREGIANAFAIAVRPDRGNVSFEFGVPYEPWFREQAADDKPLSLKKVLDAGPGAFNTGKQEERHVRQAYTLVFFLANAHDGSYRDTFVEYLRSAFDGKGAASHFEKIFGRDVEEIEAEWQEYVRQVAGA